MIFAKEAAMEHDMEKRFPTNPNDYALCEEIGEGVSATVYRALCIPLNETVAIKVLDLEKCNNDLDGIRREVQTMSLIYHPNVLRSICSFAKDQYLWVVMPYMAGGSALHIIKSSYPDGFEEPVIATLLREVLKALAYLHSHGHIHRDVKAGNILIDAHGSVKLADFGVSACMFDTGDRQKARNTFVGTPCWMAPEVMQQLHGYDFKADIWSFGITALELAHGHAPFSKYPPMKVLLMTLQYAPPGLDYERDKRFSKSFKDLVAACLVKDPGKRPSSEKLLKHPFFKHAKSSEFLRQSIVDGLPPLGERFRAIKGNEAKLLLNNIASQDKEQLSQKEYIRGISGWNFNLDELKAQADLLDCSNNDSGPQIEKNSKGEHSDLHALPIIYSTESFVGSTSTEEDEIRESEHLGEQFAAAFSISPLKALQSVFDVGDDDMDVASSRGQPSIESPDHLIVPEHNFENMKETSPVTVSITQKYLSSSLIPENVLSPCKNNVDGAGREEAHLKDRRNRSGPLPFHHVSDTLRNSAVAQEESADAKNVKHKGRFKVMDTAPKAAPSANSKLKLPANLGKPASNNAAILPTLQFLLQQNSQQKDLLIKLIASAQQLSDGALQAEASTSSSEPPESSDTEKELQAHIDNLQQRVATLSEEIQSLNLKNAQLEQQISTALSRNKNARSLMEEARPR